MGSWKQVALEEDLARVFNRETDGLVPQPGVISGASSYCLNADGSWIRVRSEDNDINSFGGLTDAPDYNTNQVDKAVKYVRGIRINSINHDAGTNTVTVYCASQHGLSQSDSVTIVDCNVAAYNGSQSLTGIIGSQGTEQGDSTAFTFSSSDSTTVTIPGYITGTTVDDNMLVFADDAGISDHSIGLTKLAELSQAMRVIGSLTGGDAEEVVIDLAPTSTSSNLVTSGSVFTALADKLNLSGGTMTSHLNLEDNVQLQLGTAGDTDYIYSDGDDIHISKDDNEIISVLDSSVKFNDNAITHAKTVGFQGEYDNGSKTADFTLNFATAQKQKVTLTANTITLTLDKDISVGNYLIKIVNGGLATLTWAGEGSATIKWAGSSAPSLTSSGTDILSFYYDGTDFYGASSLNFG